MSDARDRVQGPAYLAGIGSHIPKWLENQRVVAVILNDYQLVNLRWLLRHAHAGTTPRESNTGDWCGEILWTLEQAMLDARLIGDQANILSLWPLRGWGEPTCVLKGIKMTKKLKAISIANNDKRPNIEISVPDDYKVISAFYHPYTGSILHMPLGWWELVIEVEE